MGEKGAGIMRVSMMFDLFGYLLVAPLVLMLEQQLQPKSPYFTRLFTICGLAYSFLGAIRAVLVAEVVPTLAMQYISAPAAQRPMLELTISTFYQAVALGIWNPLEVLMASLRFMGIGSTMRKDRHVFGFAALGMGAFVLMDVLGRFINNDIVFNVGAAGMVFLPIWSLCFGIDLLRHPLEHAGMDAGRPSQDIAAQGNNLREFGKG